MPAQPEAFFLPVDSDDKSQRLYLYYPAAGSNFQGVILYVHPFAEEMNKSRRMAALQARAFANAGYAVLQIDLLGCGDSSGDFGDATWKAWVNDVVVGMKWLCQRAAAEYSVERTPEMWLWGLRAGCLLALEAAEQLDGSCNFLFWQPPATGKSLLQQFLRLRLAGDLLGGQSKGVMDSMRQQLATGSSVEIAGYMLSAGLASGLEQSVLAPPPSVNAERRMEWFEISTRADASLSPAATATIAQCKQAGIEVGSHIVNGPAFWQTTEIEDAPALVAASIAALQQRTTTAA